MNRERYSLSDLPGWAAQRLTISPDQWVQITGTIWGTYMPGMGVELQGGNGEEITPDVFSSFMFLERVSMGRRISNAELADLPESWENPTVDTSKYIQCVVAAYEVDKAVYLKHKRAGGLCQEHSGHFYIA
jgi:hypothetical protein